MYWLKLRPEIIDILKVLPSLPLPFDWARQLAGVSWHEGIWDRGREVVHSWTGNTLQRHHNNHQIYFSLIDSIKATWGNLKKRGIICMELFASLCSHKLCLQTTKCCLILPQKKKNGTNSTISSFLSSAEEYFLFSHEIQITLILYDIISSQGLIVNVDR